MAVSRSASTAESDSTRTNQVPLPVVELASPPAVSNRMSTSLIQSALAMQAPNDSIENDWHEISSGMFEDSDDDEDTDFYLRKQGSGWVETDNDDKASDISDDEDTDFYLRKQGSNEVGWALIDNDDEDFDLSDDEDEEMENSQAHTTSSSIDDDASLSGPDDDDLTPPSGVSYRRG